MESSVIFWKTFGSSRFSRSLLLTSVQIFFLSSLAARTCTSINFMPVTASGSASWLRRISDEQKLNEPNRRTLLQSTENTIPEAPILASEVTEVAENLDQDDSVTFDQLSSTTSVLTVNQFGTGDYATLQEAVDAVPIQNTQRVVIRIYRGTYREKIHIPSSRPYITFLGIGEPHPVITWNDTAASAGSTWESSTVSVDASHFIARGITFENTAPAPAPGAIGAQAVALRIGGDMAAFYHCSFLGAQDTLCDWMGRHYFQDCFIQGSIDFIFGNGQSLYENCLIHSIAEVGGSVTAHYRQTSEDLSGYSFVDCNITGSGQIFLGRAWGPYSRVVFSQTTMADVIDPRGWNDWGTPSFDESVSYGEYNNFGPGADLTQRVSYSQALTQAEAEPFLSLDWIDGGDWLDI